jgi:glutamate racemase
VGVLATEGTVASGAFIREIQKLDKKIKVLQVASPLLVPAIEAGEHTFPGTELILKSYLVSLVAQKIDTLILGCTHYSILEPAIKKIIGEDITVVTEGQVVARQLKNYLERHPEIAAKISQGNTVRFLTTDLTDNFSTLGSEFFGQEIKAEYVVLKSN